MGCLVLAGALLTGNKGHMMASVTLFLRLLGLKLHYLQSSSVRQSPSLAYFMTLGAHRSGTPTRRKWSDGLPGVLNVKTA